MNDANKLTRNLGLQLATAGVSALLLVSPAAAQSSSTDQNQASQSNAQQADQTVRAEFRQLDENDDQKLEWDEVEPRLEQADLKDQWEQDRLMGEFDENDNDALEPREYQRFVTEAGVAGSDTQQTARTQQDQEQRELEIESADVKVDPGQPEVQVKQQSPDVQVQQAETDVSVERQSPQVTVRQPKPEVTVTQPEPEVQVEMPDPEVEVTQQDPNVNVDQGQPDVQIEQQEPEVTVRREKPEVELEKDHPEVVLQRDEPEVTMADSEQRANVQTQQEDDQGQVQVEQSEPQVEVSQSEPDVTVESAGEADVTIQREGQEQAQRDQQEPGREMAADEEDVNQMEATAAGDADGQQPESLDTMSIDELQGHKIVNAQGEEVGEVDRVVMSRDQATTGVVLSLGGILGIGAEEVMAPLGELRLENDQLIWETSRSKDELKESANYNEGNYIEVSSDDYQDVGALRQNIGQ